MFEKLHVAWRSKWVHVDDEKVFITNKNGKGQVSTKMGYQHVVMGTCKKCFSKFQRVMLSHVGCCEILSPKEGWGVVWNVWMTIMYASDHISQIKSVLFNAILKRFCINFCTMLIKPEGVPSIQTILWGFPTSRGVYSYLLEEPTPRLYLFWGWNGSK